MKYIIILLATLSSHNLLCQQRNMIGLGYELMNYKSSDDLPITDNSYNGGFFTYDWLNNQNLGFGIEVHKSLSGDVNILDGRLKLGGVINGKSRIQFPIFPYIGIYSFQEDADPKLGSFLYGIMAGVRFYITDNVSAQGVYNYLGRDVSKVDDRTFEDSLGQITDGGISISLLYYFSTPE